MAKIGNEREERRKDGSNFNRKQESLKGFKEY